LINARAETVANTPAFREAFKRRRCLVLADGFYEWIGPPKARLPYRIVMADGSPMTFAGIWDGNNGLNVESFAILTTAGNVDMQAVHDRMPVILRAGDFDRWLDPAQPAADLLAPAPAETLRLFRVDPKVNSYKVDDPSCIEPLMA
jgi:putative SOS response-associated peptidase YedK